MLGLPEYILIVPAFFIGVYISWTDMKYMRIPNMACLALFGSFLVLGFLIFDLQDYGIRVAQAFIMLFIGMFLTGIGLVGGGDSKYAAAMAPFIAYTHILQFIFIVGIISFVSIGLHKLIAITPGLKSRTQNWVSWKTHGMFPFGVTLAGSLVAYLFLVNYYS